MRRVLVPLDGTDVSATILSDAVRVAGPDGALILTQEVRRIPGRAAAMDDAVFDTMEARQYLEGVASGLRARGITVTTTATTTFHVPEAIDAAAHANEVDMIACATHSRGAVGALLWGSVAWKVLAQSPVPVLLRHPTGEITASPERRRLLVPMDGSALAEGALPLASALATEWQAPVDLVLVLPPRRIDVEGSAMEDYLARMAGSLPAEVHTHVLSGDPVDELTAFARGAGSTDIVMCSHGRTGLSRVLVGSVAYAMIRRLPLPVFVIPALAAMAAVQPETVAAAEAAPTI